MHMRVSELEGLEAGCWGDGPRADRLEHSRVVHCCGGTGWDSGHISSQQGKSITFRGGECVLGGREGGREGGRGDIAYLDSRHLEWLQYIVTSYASPKVVTSSLGFCMGTRHCYKSSP